VAKNQNAAVTSSTVRRLSDEDRVAEVARMLGGVTITENTLAHAREMLAVTGDQLLENFNITR
jgi:DNA repair protein RecN (Recombination protein N)